MCRVFPQENAVSSRRAESAKGREEGRRKGGVGRERGATPGCQGYAEPKSDECTEVPRHSLDESPLPVVVLSPGADVGEVVGEVVGLVEEPPSSSELEEVLPPPPPLVGDAVAEEEARLLSSELISVLWDGAAVVGALRKDQAKVRSEKVGRSESVCV